MSGSQLKALWAIAMLLSLPASSSAADRFDESISVSLVQVPVQVLVDGQPLRGLSQDDFEIFEGRKKRKIASFDIVDLALYEGRQGEQGKVGPVPLAGRRRFLFLFDLSNVEPASLIQAREAAQQLVSGGLHPSDLAAVATYRANRGAQLILGFTSDREQLDLALMTLGSPELIDRTPDPLRLVLGAARNDLSSAVGGSEKAMQIAQATLGEAQTQLDLSMKLQEDEERNRIKNLSASFAEMAQLLATSQGRKYVVLLSEGFNTEVVFADHQDDATRNNAEHGEIWNIDSDRTFGSTSVQNDLQEMIRSFQRADCVIESIDIGGLRDGSALSRGDKGRDGLFYLANETGGELFERFNDLGEAMDLMLERTSVTYLLSFEPKYQEADGSYHAIKVELRGAPRNARILHRPGYFSPRPFEYRNSIEKSMSLADRVIGGEEGGEIEASVSAIALPGEGGEARVPLVVEVDGSSLLEFHLGRLLNAEIYVYAMSDDGRVAAFLSQLIGLNLEKHRSSLERDGLKFYGDLDLPPGEYQLRILVRNQQASTFGMHQAEIVVPDFRENPKGITPAVLLEPPGNWILVREQGSADYPFMVDGQMLLPTDGSRARELDRLVFWWSAFGLAGQELELDGRLANTSGPSPPELLWIDRGSASAHEELRFAAEIEPSRLARGIYGVELVVRDGEQDLVARSQFEVLD